MWLLALFTGGVFPIIEGLLASLTTAVPSPYGWIPGAVLAIIGLLHVGLLAIQLFSTDTSAARGLADALELERDSETPRRELRRRTEAYRMIRSAIETLNLQTCQHEPTRQDAFARGVDPIIRAVTCNIRTTLGVTSNEFTLEIWTAPHALLRVGYSSSNGCWSLEYFFSSQHLNCQSPCRAGQRSPFSWAVRRNVPGECHISQDKNFFFEGGAVPPSLYFRRLAAVPIYAVCQREQPMGFLVLTSMQEERFAEDVLDTMQFVASAISQYMASHNRCVNDWILEQKRSEERIRRQQRKLLKSTPHAQTTTTATPGSIGTSAPADLAAAANDDDDEDDGTTQ
jgi:hypothetical protein